MVDLRQAFFTRSDPEGSGGTITFNGGTLRLTGTTTTGQALAIRLTGGKVDASGNVLYLTGTITGDGANGTGTLTISGTGGGSVYLNGTDLVPIYVDPTGTLRGTGLILGNTTVAGTLSPGNSPGTLTFAAPVTIQSTGAQALDIDGTGTGNGAGNYSRVIVTGGNTSTAGGTLAPKLRGITYASGEVQGTNSYTPALGQKFTGVIQADGGVLGSFDRLTQPEGLRAGTRFDTVYNPTSVDLYVTPAAYGNLAAAGVDQTDNQARVGGALDAIRPAAGVRTRRDQGSV